MDFLALVEPQFAVPVVAVVVLAVLVYLFGFQQTQEPSFQHLAVLHSGGKSKSSSSSTTSKQKNQSQNSASGQKGNAVKGKVVSNGHVVQNKEKNKIEKALSSNKENVKPQHSEQPTPKSKKDKKVENKPEEIDGGDWIPAVSRKDKKLRPKKEDLSEPAVKSKKVNASKNESPKAVLKEVDVVLTVVAKDEKVIPASPASKDKKKKAPATTSAGGLKKQTEKSQDVPSIIESKTDDSLEEAEKNEEVLPTPEKVASDSAANKGGAKTKNPSDDPKNNIAFDEMGELWEEAKSRGAKKKRAHSTPNTGRGKNKPAEANGG